MMLRPMKHVVLRLDLLLSFLGAGGWTLSIRLLLSREKLQRKFKLVGTHVELRHKSFPLTSHISARVYFKRRRIITWWKENSAPRHSLRFDISFWSAPGERSSHHFKQFYSCINTLFVTVMTLSVFFFSPLPHLQYRLLFRQDSVIRSLISAHYAPCCVNDSDPLVENLDYCLILLRRQLSWGAVMTEPIHSAWR